MFSVVIPLYNKAHTIERTLGSVLSQTHSEFEVIIVNDGSTDNGVDVINQYTNDLRIRIIHQENQGVSAARNKGVEESKFDYIAFLDGDDEWLPDYLKEMKKAIDLFPDAGMYCCAGFIHDTNGTHLRLANKYKNKILEVNYFENPHVFSHASATIVNKPYFNKINGFPIGMICNEDFTLFYALALTSKVIYCGKSLSIYNGGIEGQTTSMSQEKRFALQKNVVDRINMSFSLWEKTDPRNTLYMIFDKYEIRGRILRCLSRNDYKTLNFLIDNLNLKIKQHYLPFEFLLYKNKNFKLLSIGLLYLTKIVWRFHGFPIVGENK